MDTLLIDGVEFPPDGTLEFPAEWAYQGNEPRGDAITYIGMDGGEIGDGAYGPVVLPLPIALHPDQDACWPDDHSDLAMAYANDRRRAMIAACKPGRDVTLTRRTSTVIAGVATAVDQTARARFVQAPVSRPHTDLNRAVVEFILLDGLWYGGEVTIHPAGTFTVDGDVRTHRMTITLTGTNPVLTNTTTGSVLSYAGSAGAGVTIEVEDGRVVAGSVANFSWNQRLPFRLTPGPNVLTLTGGGTATIVYQPAYL